MTLGGIRVSAGIWRCRAACSLSRSEARKPRAINRDKSVDVGDVLVLESVKPGEQLSRWGNSRRGSSRNGVQVDLGGDRDTLSAGLLAGAVSGNVAQFATLVAALASSAQRTAGGRRAVFADVTNLATRVALDGLSLAVTRKMVGATALVASCRARSALEAASGETTETTATRRATTANTSAGRVGAGAL